MKIVGANEADIPALTRVMTSAFEDDARKHLGLERGCPPGYDKRVGAPEWPFRIFLVFLEAEFVIR